MVDENMVRFESCKKRGDSLCPNISKMKTVKAGKAQSDETVKLNDLMDDAGYCKDCAAFEQK